ncbi:hypothetical protein [Arcticibacterium luteifluviistationis]|uniref:Uncharacterized protein n=1 Tax=Arcticibacterium luteifluviistationis TaxID=1784714 RepID=A0A2Z4GBW1_9BACT|nr:hypothetical protein [Arcticibacterium luteifluviistationis]AWV98779.1 hypothetical protein DJ013_11575 [Arcticibacterium luteifluviistationis]
MEKAYLSDLHKDHKTWQEALAFYADDLTILKERLSEVSIKNTDQEIKKTVEQFQNQFIIQEEQIDILNHDIQISEDAIVENIKENPVASDHRKMSEKTDLADRMETFKKLFVEMKDTFNDFVGKNL